MILKKLNSRLFMAIATLFIISVVAIPAFAGSVSFSYKMRTGFVSGTYNNVYHSLPANKTVTCKASGTCVEEKWNPLPKAQNVTYSLYRKGFLGIETFFGSVTGDTNGNVNKSFSKKTDKQSDKYFLIISYNRKSAYAKLHMYVKNSHAK